MRDAPLPSSCAACVFWLRGTAEKEGAKCHRHAPSPGQDEFEPVFWPTVRADDRCGQGAASADAQGPGVALCKDCMHWHQPGDQPVRPDYRRGLPAKWWAETGYCTRTAPTPSTDEDRRTFWRVTHAGQGCGDGETVPTRK